MNLALQIPPSHSRLLLMLLISMVVHLLILALIHISPATTPQRENERVTLRIIHQAQTPPAAPTPVPPRQETLSKPSEPTVTKTPTQNKMTTPQAKQQSKAAPPLPSSHILLENSRRYIQSQQWEPSQPKPDPRTTVTSSPYERQEIQTYRSYDNNQVAVPTPWGSQHCFEVREGDPLDEFSHTRWLMKKCDQDAPH